ncbi:MAG TPA: ATP-binding protein [Thermoleophilaceae bacterium]|nr:ATP-binding protein [Thermoleophilaceae bacterium]
MSPREATEDDRIATRVARGDVLAWAAMDLADVPDLDPETFDVHLMIDAVARRFAAPAQEKGIALEVKRAESVPRLALGEVEWLREVLCALIDNAVRFTDSGEVVASITADRTGGRRIVFHAEVSDTGCGMSADVLARLFGPRHGGRFTPLGGLDGTGTLGVAHRLVELMDGRLGCSSALGLGTTTWFTVPLDLP